MTQARKLTLLFGLTILSVGLVWFFVIEDKQAPPDEISQAEACDSCSARHQNLTRLRDAGGLSAMADE